MNKQMNALHVASFYLNEKRALNSSLQNSCCKVGFQGPIMALKFWVWNKELRETLPQDMEGERP